MGTWITISLSGMMMPDADGFEQNTTIEYRQQGIRGDVTGDAILLLNHVGYHGVLAEPTQRGDMEKL